MPTGKKISKAKSAPSPAAAPVAKAVKSKPVSAKARTVAKKPVKAKVAEETPKVAEKVAAKAKPVKAVKPVKAAAKKVAPPEVAVAAVSPAVKAREKKLVELFGPSMPKGKGLDALGEPILPAQLETQGWCLMQFPPPAGRMSWIYSTHGLSSTKAKNADKPTRIELVMHWKEKSLVPLQLLNEIVQYILNTGNIPVPGHIVTAADGITTNIDLARHFVTMDGAPAMPSKVEIPGGGFTPLIMLGISDAELEYAMKVPPLLADGKQVLKEALRKGGVFPVTDPKRLCLTRRRDFNKIWESSFKTLRERKGS